MKMIDTKTLISEIDAKKKSKFIIEFNGIINMKRKIKSIEIYEDEDNINIVDKEYSNMYNNQCAIFRRYYVN